MGRAKVGQSGVTPCKHFLLNALLGQEAGVIGRGNLPQCDSAYWVDLTAGDGAATQVAEPEKSCSPAIFARHCAFVAKHGKPVQAHLYERASTNYSKLVDALDTVWLEQYPDAKGSLFTHNVDSSNLQLDLGSRTACFLYNDPNSIDDWAFTREFLTSAPPYTRTLTTMGCNVGGLKRVLSDSPERSDLWRGNVEMLFQLQRHNLVLFAVGDASQWAYLISTPDVWLDDAVKLCHKAHRFQTQTARAPRVVTSLQVKEFDSLLDELMMTKTQLLERGLIQQELTL